MRRGRVAGFGLTVRIGRCAGVKESDTGLAPPSTWDLIADKQMLQEEQPLQVARCTKIINPGTEEAKYMIALKPVRVVRKLRRGPLSRLLSSVGRPCSSRLTLSHRSDLQVRGRAW